MYVDVDGIGRNCQEQEVRRLVALRHKTLVCAKHGLVEIGMTHKAAVHKEELLGALALDAVQVGAESAHLYDRCLHLDGKQSLVHLAAEQVDNTLF
jgi:hypothetical protein